MTCFAALAVALASTVLYSLFEDGGWFWRVIGAIVVVALTGLLTRRLRVPTVAAPLVALVTLTTFGVFCFERAAAPAGFVPTPYALSRLAGLAGQGLNSINHYAAPVPPLAGITLLTTLGVGIVAILVDLLAVRMRRAALAGLPLLALFGVPVAVQEDDVGWVSFALGAAGFLALLVVDGRDRVSHWGRPVLARQTDEWTKIDETPDSRSLSAAGRRIGLAAVAVAIVIPLAAPGLHPTSLVGFGGISGGHGGSTNTITIPDPAASLKGQITEPDAVPVLTYTTTDPSPQYLRIYALDVFNGQKWTMSRTSARREDRVNGRTLPAPEGLTRARVRDFTTHVHVSERMRKMRFLPLPYPPARIDVPGDWRLDKRSFMVFSNRDSAGGRDYTVHGRHVVPTRSQLQAAPEGGPDGRAYLNLPDLPPKVRSLADRITRDEVTPYAKAMAIQRWFTTGNRFTYSLNRPPGNGTSALADFLLRDRVGYCEQFAAAMAVLARMNRIPARVAIGYTAGTRTSGDRWVVTTRDAHAWPELYFAGAGWIRFEPTPSGVVGQGTATTPQYATAVTSPGDRSTGSTGDTSTTAGETGSTGATPSAGPHRPRMRDDWGGSVTAPPVQPAGSRPALGLLAGVIVLVAAAPRLVRSLTRRRRWSRARGDAARSRAAWQELRDDAIDLGWRWPSSATPRSAARQLRSRLAEPATAGTPGDAATDGTDDAGADGAGAGGAGVPADVDAALSRITTAEERARYAPDPVPGAGLADDVRLVRRAMAAVTPRAARWRGRVLPLSTLRSMRRGAVRTLDVFAWTDLLASRIRARLTRDRTPGPA